MLQGQGQPKKGICTPWLHWPCFRCLNYAADVLGLALASGERPRDNMGHFSNTPFPVPPRSNASISLYQPWKWCLGTNHCLKPLRQVHKVGVVRTTPVLGKVTHLVTGGCGACQPPLSCPALLVWWVRHRTLGTFSCPPTPGNTGFVGGEKAICCSWEQAHDAKAGDWEENRLTCISFKGLYQKRKENFIFFLMSGQWKLKTGYPSMSLWYLKLLWAIGKHKALPFVLLFSLPG